LHSFPTRRSSDLGQQAGFYFYNRFEDNDGQPHYFINRRTYSNQAGIIHDGDFGGFEMLLIDTRNDAIIVRHNYYADTRNPPHLQPADQDRIRSEEHTSELQSREKLVCRLLLEKKKDYNAST